jgi:anti-sigma B factor antagonist
VATVQDPLATIASRQVGTTWELCVEGEVDLVSAPGLAEAIRSGLRAGPETLVVDLSKVEFIDSSGLHVLIEARHRAAAADVALVVIRPTGPAGRIFAVSGVHALFPDLAPAAPHQRFLNDRSL